MVLPMMLVPLKSYQWGRVHNVEYWTILSLKIQQKLKQKKEKDWGSLLTIVESPWWMILSKWLFIPTMQDVLNFS